MSRLPNPPEFAWPARFAYTYGWRVLGWLLEGHAKLRETLTRVWPRGVRRALHLTERIAEIPFVIGGLRLPPGSRILDVGSRWSPLPLFLAAMGYRVAAVDLTPFPIRGSGPDLVLADMWRRPPSPDQFPRRKRSRCSSCEGPGDRVKVAIFHDYLETIGGAERLVLTLARHFQADLITTSYDPALPARAGFGDVNVISLGTL